MKIRSSNINLTIYHLMKSPVLTCLPRFSAVLPEGPDLLPPGRPRHGGPEDGGQPRQLRRPLRQPGLVQQPQLQVSVYWIMISCWQSVVLSWDHNNTDSYWGLTPVTVTEADSEGAGTLTLATMLSSQHRGGINGNQLISTKGWCERSSCRSTFCQQALLMNLINWCVQCTLLIQTKGNNWHWLEYFICRVAGYDPDGHNCYLSAVEVSRLTQLDLAQVS